MINKYAIIITAIILTASGFAAPSIYALSGLSVHAGAGYNNDGANKGKSIMSEGLGYSDNTGTYTTPTGQLLIPEFAFKNYPYTGDEELDGPMRGLNAVVGLRFDFLNRFFIRADCEFEKKVMGGNMEWEWQYNSGRGYPYDNESSYQGYDYDLLSIPVMFGLNIPVKTKGAGNYNLYIGAGAAWSLGSFSFEMEHPYGFIMASGNPLSGFHEEKEMSSMLIGFAWTFGLNAEITNGLFLFIEYRELNFTIEKYNFTFKNLILGNMNYNQPYSMQVDYSSKIIRVGVLYNIFSFSGK